jgi:hypothetical protein
MTEIENRPLWREYFPYLAKGLSKCAAPLVPVSKMRIKQVRISAGGRYLSEVERRRRVRKESGHGLASQC